MNYRIGYVHLPIVPEIKMFQGLTLMVNDSMCIGIREDETLHRIDPDGYRQIKNNFDYWIEHDLDLYNRVKAIKGRLK